LGFATKTGSLKPVLALSSLWVVVIHLAFRLMADSFPTCFG